MRIKHSGKKPNTEPKHSRLRLYEWLLIISTVCITPLRIFTYIATMSSSFRLIMTFIALGSFCLSLLCMPVKNAKIGIKLLFATFIFGTLNYLGQWRNMLPYAEKMYAYYLMFLPLILGVVFIDYDNMRVKKVLLYFIAAMELITLVTTIAGLQKYPYAARDLASTAGIEEYKLANIGGYDFIYGLVLIVPMFLYILHFKKKKIITFAVFLAVLYCILIAQYTTAVLVSVFSVILYYLLKTSTKKRLGLIMIFVAASFLVLLFSDSIFVSLGNYFEDLGLDSLATKMFDIGKSVDMGGSIGTVEMRTSLFAKSLNTFVKHPILGRFVFSESPVGGHSEILDILASGGMVSFVLVVYVLHQYRIRIKRFAGKELYNCFVCMYICFIAVASVNTVLNNPVISINAFLLPALFTNKRHGEIRRSVHKVDNGCGEKK